MQRSLLLLTAFFFFAIGLRAQSCLGDTILYEDFANGFSGNNGLGLSWDTSGTYQAWRDCPSNCGSNGPYTDVGPLQSSTASNGYVNLDMQYAAGYVDTTGGPPPVQHMTVGPMDLSALNDPSLRFQTTFYHCCASGHELEVRVSTDGGTTWGDTIAVLPYISSGQQTDNPARVRIPLDSAIAANPSNVALRFTWPPTLSGSQVSGVYNWYIDDVWVGELNENDLEARETTYKLDTGDFMMNYGNPLEYTMIPEFAFPCLRGGGEICNVGKDSVPDIRLRTRISELPSGTQVYQSSSSADTLPPMSCLEHGTSLFDPDTIWDPSCFSPNDTGLYEIEYKAYSDDTADCAPSDNFGDKERFIMSEEVLALDEYAISGNLNGSIVTPSDGSGNYKEFTAYNAFQFETFDGNGDTIKYMSFYIHDTAEAGAGPIRAGICPNVSRSPSSHIYGLTNEYYVDPADIGSWVTLPIIQDGQGDSLPNGLPVSELKNTDSLITAYVYATSGLKRIGIGTSGKNTENGSWAQGDFGGGGSALYRSSRIPMLRIGAIGGCQNSISPTVCDSFTVPSGDTTYTSSGTYQDTLAGYFACDSVFSINLTIDSSFSADLSVFNDTLYANPNGTSYDWMDCDTSSGGIISSASGPLFVPDSNGMYSVAVMDSSSNCSDSSSYCRTSLPNSVWDASSVPKDTLLSSMYMVDSANMWVTGYGGTIQRTSNSGNSWTLQLDTNFALLDIHFEDTLNGWVVGANGEILTTSNGGATWNAQSSGVSDTLTDCHFLSTSEGWVAGHNGLLLKTTNGGSSWSSQPSGVSTDLHALYFRTDSLAWTAGKTGTVLKTTDAGNTWNPQSTGSSEDLYDITFASDTAGWTVGTNGTVLHTDDGGSSWSYQSSGTYETLFSINMLSPNVGWIVGGNGAILTTTSARAIWNSVLDARLHNLRDIAVLDAKTAHIVGEEGTYLRKGAGTSSLRSRKDLSDRISVHPNPAKDRVRLELEGARYGDKRYTLYTSMGRTAIERTAFSGRSSTLDISELESGIYFLKVEWKGERGQHRRAVKKLLVE